MYTAMAAARNTTEGVSVIAPLTGVGALLGGRVGELDVVGVVVAEADVGRDVVCPVTGLCAVGRCVGAAVALLSVGSSVGSTVVVAAVGWSVTGTGVDTGGADGLGRKHILSPVADFAAHLVIVANMPASYTLHSSGGIGYAWYTISMYW
jgi:hypothetical protein